mmetsp:Transcript_125777/g.367591  ORF Transcript_125777/g.367591 Transcript_125777/m.367591 type:complete len:261 (-) Transcript_125777:449-1231(-)
MQWPPPAHELCKEGPFSKWGAGCVVAAVQLLQREATREHHILPGRVRRPRDLREGVPQLCLCHEEHRLGHKAAPTSERPVCPHAAAPYEDVVAAPCPLEVAKGWDQGLEEKPRLVLRKGLHVQVASRVMGHEEEVRLRWVVRAAGAGQEPVMQHDLEAPLVVAAEGRATRKHVQLFIVLHVVDEDARGAAQRHAGLDLVARHDLERVPRHLSGGHADARALARVRRLPEDQPPDVPDLVVRDRPPSPIAGSLVQLARVQG